MTKATDSSFRDDPNADYQATPKQERWYQKAFKKLRRQRWRLNHLYDIVDSEGEIVKFKMRLAQKILYYGMWYLNIVLKSRQHGITTFICLFFLDTCMFNSNTHACIIAHNKEDAQDFFTKKIMFAYNSLHPLIRESVPAKRSSSKELTFENGSSIRVTTSGRSGTYQLVHISEFGKICAKYPHKAQEIITGTLNAVHAGRLVFIESTAEGREGEFYDMTTKAQKLRDSNQELTKLDWKFFFFGWMDNPLNQMEPDDARKVPITERFKKYFAKVETELRRKIPLEYKAWYIKKEEDQGELMFREHPSTPEEAFLESVKGVYFQNQMVWLRKNNRILTQTLYNPQYPVNTWWDIGYNDVNAIWFAQTVGMQILLVHYYENSGEGFAHYAQYLKDLQTERNWKFGDHIVGHDMDNHDYSIGQRRSDFAKEFGLNFTVVPRMSKETLIEAARKLLPYCVFDLEECDTGIKCLESHRKEWDEKRAAYRNHPYHDWTSNGADAFKYGAINHPLTKRFFDFTEGGIAKLKPVPDRRGWSA